MGSKTIIVLKLSWCIISLAL